LIAETFIGNVPANEELYLTLIKVSELFPIIEAPLGTVHRYDVVLVDLVVL
jgi:hypothetical protein